MLTIIYSINGVPNADGKSEELAWHLYNNEKEYTTSTDSLITAVRLLVAEGKIPHDDVRIIFENQELKLNSYGELERSPIGFCDSERHMLRRMLETRRNKDKANYKLNLEE